MLRGTIFVAIVLQTPGLEKIPTLELNLHQNRNTILEAQASQGIRLLNVMDTSSWDPPSPDPVGIDYHPGLGRLIVSDSEVDEMGIFQGVNIFEVSTSGQVVATCNTLSFASEPSGIAVNPDNGHIFIAQDDHGKIYEVEPARDGDQCSYDKVVNTIDTGAFNSYDLEGLAYGEGKLFIAVGEDVDGAGINVLSPGPNKIFDGIPPTGDDQVTKFDTLSLGLQDPEGIGFHPERGTLFIVSRTEKMLVETTTSGKALESYSLSFTEIKKPSGVGIGPSSLDPEKYSIYVTARGVDNDQDPNENDGKIYELGLMDITYFPLIFR
jgi:DNA-binding beta-propeller fold protein YncE